MSQLNTYKTNTKKSNNLTSVTNPIYNLNFENELSQDSRLFFKKLLFNCNIYLFIQSF